MWNIDELLVRIGLRSDSIGLALGGGGARGFVHVGVLKAFKEYGMTPDIISGVSAGSISAVLWSAGLTSEEILECFIHQSKFNDYTELMIPKKALFKLNKFEKLLDSWLPVKRLEELEIPTVVCATDIEHGKSVGWSKGEIVPRVVASCSIPIIFPPVAINGVNYVDGGVLRNLPAWAIRQYCRTLYGSNCSPLNREYKFKGTIVDIALRSYQLMAKSNTLQDIKLCDYLIQPAGISIYGTFDLKIFRSAMDRGYTETMKLLETDHSRKSP